MLSSNEPWLAQESGEIVLGFELDARSLFFVTVVNDSPPRGVKSEDTVSVRAPTLLFVGERRERLRSAPHASDQSGWNTFVVGVGGERWPARIEDASPGGLGLRVSASMMARAGEELWVEMGHGAGRNPVSGEVRYRRSDAAHPGWAKVGLRIDRHSGSGFTEIDARARKTNLRSRVQSQAQVMAAGARLLARRAIGAARRQAIEPWVVRFASNHGEPVVGLIDATGDPRGAPAVVIPPAWGKTKETLLPLARTLVAMFEAVGQPLVVLRFDGVRRRGESHTEALCRVPGREHHLFSISQGVRDIAAAVEFLAGEFSATKIVIVSFSASAIEARRAVVEDQTGSVIGWVPVVAPPDLQSAMRVVSGGLDYLAGAERGLKFGLREVLGIEIDVDLANADAIEHKLAFLEDACRDFSRIDVPVSWVHGVYDGWMNLDRVRTVLSYGRQDNRKLIVVPTGHQLRNSKQAIEVFSLIGSEVAGMVRANVRRVIPDLLDLESRRRAERARLPSHQVDLYAFWRDYLLGRNGNAGMALMAQAPSYRRLMARQADLLRLQEDDVVADLGSGLGALFSELATRSELPPVRVVEIDLVRDALRTREPLGPQSNIRLERVSADLGRAPHATIPLGVETCSAVLASLLISYLPDPASVLRECLRVMRPGGRLVVSTLKRDADLSRIWIENEKELRATWSHSAEDEAQPSLDDSLRSFFNDASRVLLLEESGLFTFWEPEELGKLVESCGFRDVQASLALGDPPQAVLVSAVR